MTSEDNSYPVCSNHPQRPARWICPDCGKIFCEQCVVPAESDYYCRDCVDREAVAEGSENFLQYPDFPRDANLVKRLLAFEYDFVLLLLLVIPFTGLIEVFFNPSATVINTVFFSLLYLGLLVRDLCTPVGSPGKYLTGLYVWSLRRDSQPGTVELVGRNLLFPIFYLDVLSPPFSHHFQRLAERISGTVVYDFEQPVNERKYIYRLATVTGGLVFFLVLIFALWLHGEVRERAWLDFDADERVTGDVVDRIEAGLDSVEPARVQPLGNDSYRLVAEFESAEKYYTARRKIDRILSQKNYQIVDSRGPRVINRGRDQTFYRLEIKISKNGT